MLEEAKKKRDRILRASLLRMLNYCRISPTGGISGRQLLDGVNGLQPPRQGFEGDSHGLLLMRDLVAAGLATERPLGERRRGQGFTIDWIEFAVTDKGVQLFEQKIAAHPLVDDDRQIEE